MRKTFFKRVEMENGNIRCGMSSNELPEIFAKYDVVATSSIFTVQTRMHFEIAAIAKKVMRENKKLILTVSGGVNARSLREHFLSNGFDIIGLGDGENTIVQIVNELSTGKPDYSKVERIAYRKDGKTIITPDTIEKLQNLLMRSTGFGLITIRFISNNWNSLGNPILVQNLFQCKLQYDKCILSYISGERGERFSW